MASGKSTCRSVGGVVTSLLALGRLSVAHSASFSPSCVQITDASFSSSCASGTNSASFEFWMEGSTEMDPETAKMGTTKTARDTTTLYATAGGPTVRCPATDVTVTVEFGAPVTSVAYRGATITGSNSVTYRVGNLESNPTMLDVVLDTTGIASGASMVSSVAYSDSQNNSPDFSGLLAVGSPLECGGGSSRDAAGIGGAPYVASRELQSEEECAVCSDLTSAQEEELVSSEGGPKTIICDATCLDGVTDPLHCNYFGLGQICRGCGDCDTCSPCPEDTPSPIGIDGDATPSTPSPIGLDGDTTPSTPAPIGLDGDAGGDDDGFDCTPCSELSSAQEEALASFDNGGKIIVCDPTCLDGVSDPLHCNYFGLGQICRGCGDCETCSPCPEDTPSPIGIDGDATPSTPAPIGIDGDATPSTPAPIGIDGDATPSTPAPIGLDGDAGSPTPAPIGLDGDAADDDDFDCSPCSELSSAQEEALGNYENGGKVIVCDPTCLDGVSDPLHCNYFGLGQICRGCGECPTCTPCP